MQPPRVVILSDTHLGKPGRGAKSVDALRPLWEGASEVIVNGDVAEVHDAEFRCEAARMVVRLNEYCEADNVQVTLLSGNHDPLITDRRFLRLLGGEVFVTHGDILHPAISPWIAERKLMKALHEDALAALDPSMRDQIDAQAAAAQIAELKKWDWHAEHDHERPPKWKRMLSLGKKVPKILWYWHTLPRVASRFAAKHVPECRFFIFGHIHRSGIWQLGGRTIINTGSYDFPSKPRGVVIEAGELRVHPIQLRSDVYTFGEPLRVFALENQLAQQDLGLAAA